MNENLAVILIVAKFNIPVCPDAGGVALCEYVQHLSIFDCLRASTTLENRVTEFVDHLQADMTLSRDFSFTERVGLQFRAEAYNILNHPSFGSIYNSLDNGPLFGQAYTSLGSQLGGLSSIYQLGGARSMQLALKLHF